MPHDLVLNDEIMGHIFILNINPSSSLFMTIRDLDYFLA
jgi:hypothetical protein